MGENTTAPIDEGQADFAVNFLGYVIMDFMDESIAKNLKKKPAQTALSIVGWREWVALPDLGIDQIKAKIDSGAKTSALHAFEIKSFKIEKHHYIRFKVHPLQKNKEIVVEATAKVIDIRWIMDSGGHRERRYVINTTLTLGKDSWPIEMTLTNRDTMNFRMLLGRSAMKKRLIINPAKSFLSVSEPNS